MPRRLARVGLGLALLFAGISHLSFARDEFQAQVPSWFPAKDFTVLASGAVEITPGSALVAWALWSTGALRAVRGTRDRG